MGSLVTGRTYVRSCRQSDALCADGQREDLADEDPCAGAPGGGEEEDVEAREDDEAGRCSFAAFSDGADDTD
jgi:hypothetical protein